MKGMYDHTLDLYHMPDISSVGSDNSSRVFARTIAGGKIDFTKVYSGQRARKADFKQFYNMMLGKDDIDDTNKAFRGIL